MTLVLLIIIIGYHLVTFLIIYGSNVNSISDGILKFCDGTKLATPIIILIAIICLIGNYNPITVSISCLIPYFIVLRIIKSMGLFDIRASIYY